MVCLVSGIATRQKEFRKKQEETCCSHGENLAGNSMASQKWKQLCSERNIDWHDISVNYILKFLTLLYESGLGSSPINTARSAVSSLYCGSTCLAGTHPLISLFMRGVYISRPTQSRYTICDVKVVLDYLGQWKDNKELSLKELSLKTITLVALL